MGKNLGWIVPSEYFKMHGCWFIRRDAHVCGKAFRTTLNTKDTCKYRYISNNVCNGFLAL